MEMERVDFGYECPDCGGRNGYHYYKHRKNKPVAPSGPEFSLLGALSIIIALFGILVAAMCPPIGGAIIIIASKIGGW